MADARDIYQGHLDFTSQLLWDRDYDALVVCMRYPHAVRTKDRTVVVAGPDALRAFARDFRDNIAALGVTAYLRICQEAEHPTPDSVVGVHVTYALRGATPVIEPFRTRMHLERVDGRWIGGDIETAARNADIRVNVARIDSGAA